ncbi:MAG: hypothetical protein WAM97_17645, partial [Acidimicrobiales bacterium]
MTQVPVEREVMEKTFLAVSNINKTLLRSTHLATSGRRGISLRKAIALVVAAAVVTAPFWVATEASAQTSAPTQKSLSLPTSIPPATVNAPLQPYSFTALQISGSPRLVGLTGIRLHLKAGFINCDEITGRYLLELIHL